MLDIHPKCSSCDKVIKGNDEVYVKMRYPKRKGFTEIKAYLRNEGQLICVDCFDNKEKL